MDSEPRISIIHILDKNRFDTGSVHQMFQAAAGLRQRGHTVTIISRQDSTLAARAREQSISFVPAPFSSDLDARTVAIIRSVMREQNADVVHVHKGRPHTLALAATWSRPLGAFIVNRGVSFPLTLWNRPKYRTRRVDRIVTVCEAIKEVVVRSGKVPPSRVEVIYAGTDTELFDPGKWRGQEFRAEKGIGADRFLIAQVGVRDWKGWRELLDAFAEVRTSRGDGHLAFIGCRNDGEAESVRSYASARGVADAVTAVEVRSDMPRVFAAADCVVDASWAGTGITGTIREAMAMRRPVIATDGGGNRELISSPELGWLVPPREPRALASALMEVMSDPERAERVAANGQRHVQARFSAEARIARLEELYVSILREKKWGEWR